MDEHGEQEKGQDGQEQNFEVRFQITIPVKAKDRYEAEEKARKLLETEHIHADAYAYPTTYEP